MAAITKEQLEVLRAQLLDDSGIVQIVQAALDDRTLTVPPPRTSVSFYAGGTNMCPNSDFAFSKKAATVANTLPSEVHVDNNRCYRVYFQENDTNVSSNLVEAVPASAWHPIWDKVNGVIGLGYTDNTTHVNNDIAIQFTNNWLVGSRRWHIRVALALDGPDPIPVGLKLFAGFWVKRSTGPSQGWATGGQFVLDYKYIGVPGSTQYEYKVIARTDQGHYLESQVLALNTVPDTLGGLPADNKVQIKYDGASGFIEFKVYRRSVTSGEVHLIAYDRNSDKLFAYDTGQNLGPALSAFPSVDINLYRAYEEIEIEDVTDIAVGKKFHDLIVRVPANFDASDIVREGTYLRIGVIGDTAANRQVLLDTIWAAESYNVWSPSPFDDYPSAPSTTMTSGPPTSGGNPDGPPTPGPTCVWEEHDVYLGTGWETMRALRYQDRIASGTSEQNTIGGFINGVSTQTYSIILNTGLVIRCTPVHRFIRNIDDKSGITADSLQVGDTLWGGCNGDDFEVTVEAIGLSSAEELKVRTIAMVKGSPTRFYAVGDRTTGMYVYSHNRKGGDPIITV